MADEAKKVVKRTFGVREEEPEFIPNKSMVLQAVRGTRDILPKVQQKWSFVEGKFEQYAKLAGFDKIEIPILEREELYVRSTGKDTDIVSKEMFKIEKREADAESIVLRPEGTPGIVRAFIENGLYTQPMPVKLFYFGSMFRYDRPQAGRFREFKQFGLEVLGDADAAADVELISMVWKIYNEIGLKNLAISINSIGCKTCRPAYTKGLVEYLTQYKKELCPDCIERTKRNPLRVLDCKVEACQSVLKGAPQTTEMMCADCKKHFEEVQKYLNELGIPFELNRNLVRGLDYYSRTVFEIAAKDSEGAQSALGGGGRYDEMIESFGGPKTAALGFAGGIDRIIHKMVEQKIETEEVEQDSVCIVQLGDIAKTICLQIQQELWEAGIHTVTAFGKPSIKAQLKLGNKKGSKYAIIVGQREAIDNSVIIRNMKEGVQETASRKTYLAKIKKNLGL